MNLLQRNLALFAEANNRISLPYTHMLPWKNNKELDEELVFFLSLSHACIRTRTRTHTYSLPLSWLATLSTFYRYASYLIAMLDSPNTFLNQVGFLPSNSLLHVCMHASVCNVYTHKVYI